MSRIVIFGAGGRAGRHAVREAQARGHEVTAVVRDPSRYAALATDHVTVVAGDVTDRAQVAAVADGHDAAISAVYDGGADPTAFYIAAAEALSRADVGRLVVVTIATLLEAAPGVRLVDSPEFPAEYRPFCLGHAAGLDVLAAAPPRADWLAISPAGDFQHGGVRTGGYRASGLDVESRISYPDFAIALIDEIETPKHHRTHLAVTTS
ncbi:NAD(P)H-binding protein [Actinomycetes bacterium KLBMP 9797]